MHGAENRRWINYGHDSVYIRYLLKCISLQRYTARVGYASGSGFFFFSRALSVADKGVRRICLPVCVTGIDYLIASKFAKMIAKCCRMALFADAACFQNSQSRFC